MKKPLEPISIPASVPSEETSQEEVIETQNQPKTISSRALEKSKNFQSLSKQLMDLILIAGKPQEYWEDRLSINWEKISKNSSDVGPEDIKSMVVTIAKSHQISTQYIRAKKAQLGLLKAELEKKVDIAVNDKIKEIKKMPGRLPARETLAKAEKHSNSEIADAIDQAEIEIDFFESIRDNLKFQLEALKQINISNSQELKLSNIQ